MVFYFYHKLIAFFFWWLYCIGFKESRIACCGTGPYRGMFSCGGKWSIKEYKLCENVSEYVFLDSIHPSEKASQQFVELMWDGTLNITGPYNLKEFFENKWI